LGVEQFGGEGAGERVYGVLLSWRERCAICGQFGKDAGEFGLADGFGLLLEGNNGWDSFSRVQVLAVFFDFGGDDALGGSGFAATVGQVGGGYLLEVVNVVDEAAFDLVHLRVDVAGDGDVDEEHGAVAALG